MNRQTQNKQGGAKHPKSAQSEAHPLESTKSNHHSLVLKILPAQIQTPAMTSWSFITHSLGQSLKESEYGGEGKLGQLGLKGTAQLGVGGQQNLRNKAQGLTNIKCLLCDSVQGLGTTSVSEKTIYFLSEIVNYYKCHN